MIREFFDFNVKGKERAGYNQNIGLTFSLNVSICDTLVVWTKQVYNWLLNLLRVMSDELARWKSALYYKYRESHTALQSLLEEHSKIRALNNATRR